MSQQNQNLIVDLVEDAAPVVPVNLFRRCGAVMLAMTAYLAALVLISDVRPDWSEQIATTAYVCEMLVTLLITYGAAILAIRLSIPAEQRNMPINWLFIALAIVLGVIIWLLGQVSLQTLEVSLASNHFYITLGVIAVAAPVAAGLMLMIRQGAPTQLGWAGSMAMLSATGAGHFVMRTVGQADNFADVLIWCYSPVLVFALVGVWMGEKILRW